MKCSVVEISGYIPSFMAMYMTGKNCTLKKMEEIKSAVFETIDYQGFARFYARDNGGADQSFTYVNWDSIDSFYKFINTLFKYGVKEEHESLLDFIKISIHMEGIHRGAQDDYDAHAKRMTIIRSSTRANKKSTTQPELSDWYKDKVKIMSAGYAQGDVPPLMDSDDVVWLPTPFGYVREDLINNSDVLRGLVPLGLAGDNVSVISFRDLRHVYSLRREGTHASPELQQAMEMLRDDLLLKMPPLGDMLGKVWVTSGGGHFEESNNVMLVSKNDLSPESLWDKFSFLQL